MKKHLVPLILLVPLLLIPSSLMPVHAQIQNDPLFSRVLDAELTIKEPEKETYDISFKWSIGIWNQNNETISIPSCRIFLLVVYSNKNNRNTHDCGNTIMKLYPGLTKKIFYEYGNRLEGGIPAQIRMNLDANFTHSPELEIGGIYNATISGIKAPPPDESFSSSSNITYDQIPENWGEILGESGLPISLRLQDISYTIWDITQRSYTYEVSAEVEFYNPLSRIAEVTTPNTELGHLSISAITPSGDRPIFNSMRYVLPMGTTHEFKPGAVVKTMKEQGGVKNYTQSMGENITYLISYIVDGQPSDYNLPLTIIVNGDNITKIVSTESLTTHEYSNSLTTTISVGLDVNPLNFLISLAVMTFVVAKTRRRH